MKGVLMRWMCFMAFLSALPGMAQTEADALLHSQSAPLGTARARGMAGAFSAVGADMSAATLNPAGMGLYRRSAFVITPTYFFIDNDADYLDGSGTGRATQLGIPNFGFAFFNERYTGYGRNRQRVERGLLSYTFFFGNNQVQNYHRESNARGFNEFSSVSELFAERADGTFYDEFNQGRGDALAQLAWNSFAIDTLAGRGGTSYMPAVNDGRVQQAIQMKEEGRRNEWFFGLAGNVQDKLYFGATVGIQMVRYERTLILVEEDVEGLHEFYQNNPDDPDFPLEFPMERLEFTNNYSTRGSGINARLGLIYRPTDAFRLGASIQTPTYLVLQDRFGFSDTKVRHTYTVVDDNGNDLNVLLGDSLGSGEFDYNLSTPFVATFGAMMLFKKHGFISADVDWIDYSRAKFSTDADLNSGGFDTFETENENIGRLFKSALNIRLGGELRLDVFRVRAGAGLYTSALEEEAARYLGYPNTSQTLELNADRLILSAGFGIRQPNYYIDVSFVNQQGEDKLSPYVLANPAVYSPTLVNKRSVNAVSVSVGFNL